MSSILPPGTSSNQCYKSLQILLLHLLLTLWVNNTQSPTAVPLVHIKHTLSNSSHKGENGLFLLTTEICLSSLEQQHTQL